MGWHLGCIMKMLGRAQQRNDGCGGSFCVVLSYCTVHTTVYSTVLYVLYYQRLARTTCLLDGWSQMDVTKEQKTQTVCAFWRKGIELQLEVAGPTGGWSNLGSLRFRQTLSAEVKVPGPPAGERRSSGRLSPPTRLRGLPNTVRYTTTSGDLTVLSVQ